MAVLFRALMLLVGHLTCKKSCCSLTRHPFCDFSGHLQETP